MVISFHKANIFCKRLIKKLFAVALIATDNFEIESEVEVTFVSEEQIKKLNQTYRSVDKITDVLSFPQLEIKYPKKLQDFAAETSPDGLLRLGDIVI